MSSSVIILTNQNELSYTGDKAKGDGFYGFSDGLHTVSFHVHDFVGRIWLEATLMEDPTEDDWFVIDLAVSHPYFEYDHDSDTRGSTFTGNFVFLRAHVDRSYLVATEYDPVVHGVLDKVTLVI
jgi:hypothetical protein